MVKHYNKMKIMALTVLILISITFPAHTTDTLGDTGMFVSATTVKPNVLVLMDKSVSMGVQRCWETYDPAKDYRSLGYNPYCTTGPASKCYDTNSIYYNPSGDGTTWVVYENYTSTSQLNSSSCSPIISDLTTVGVSDTKSHNRAICPKSKKCTYGVFCGKQTCNSECAYFDAVTTCLTSDIKGRCSCCGDGSIFDNNAEVRLGNFLNFKERIEDNSSANCLKDTRMGMARRAIKNALATKGYEGGTTRLRLGLMATDTISVSDATGVDCTSSCLGGSKADDWAVDVPCRHAQGGYVVSAIRDESTNYNSFINALNGLTPDNSSDGTPLASALAEAGLYFAGQNSWASQAATFKTSLPGDSAAWVSGTRRYKTPIDWRCQRNFIILITDGRASEDDGTLFTKDNTIGQFGRRVDESRNLFENNYMTTYGSSIAGTPMKLNSCPTNSSIKDYDCDGVDPYPGSLCKEGASCYHANYRMDKSGPCGNAICDPFWDDCISHGWWNNIWYGDMQCPSSGSSPCCADSTIRNKRDKGLTHWADDVASFLYNEDIIGQRQQDGLSCTSPITVSDPLEWNTKQNITTYVVGYKPDNLDDANQIEPAQLNSIISRGTGGEITSYYNIMDENDMETVFSTLLSKITTKSSQFVSPVVPIDSNTKVYSGSSVYLGLFKTSPDKPWYGNIKKYWLNDQGLLLQNDGVTQATDADGMILGNASSCWSTNDGYSVISGGIGNLLKSQTTRTFYTMYNNSLANFTTTNTDITYDDFNVSNDTEKDDLINYITGKGIYAQTGSSARDWLIGDILHFKPLVLTEGTTSNYIFSGTNGGLLHCFQDTLMTPGGSGTVTEKWAYIPPELIGKLHKMRETTYPLYYVDGNQAAYNFFNNVSVTSSITGEKRITFGLRRAGNTYNTLKIGTVRANAYTYTAPVYEWIYPNETFPADMPEFGLSFGKPVTGKLKYPGATGGKEVVIVGGGYDANIEDNINIPGNPAGGNYSVDALGMSVNVVDSATGLNLFSWYKDKDDCDACSDMKYSVIDVLAFDRTGDGFIDTIYAADTGGQIFVFWNFGNSDTSWESKRLFAAEQSSNRSYCLKFLSPPDVMIETALEDYVFIGTGDREHPKTEKVNKSGSTSIRDRFYCIKNNFGETSTVYTSDLEDVTNHETDKYNNQDATGGYNISGTKGWMIEFTDYSSSDTRRGEKVVAQPIVYDGVVYFNTYAPPQLTGTETIPCASDKCLGLELGTSRLYAIAFNNGKAVFDRDDNGALQRTDREFSFGNGPPTESSLIVKPNGIFFLTATGTGIDTSKLKEERKKANTYFWFTR